MNSILKINNLIVDFFTDRGVARALDKVSFKLEGGESLGIVGESGCGKSVTALSIMQLIPSPPGKIVSGEIIFEGEDLLRKSERQMRKIRGKDISMIFQEPMTALDPVFTIGSQLTSVIRRHQGLSNGDARDLAIRMMQKIDIPIPEKRIDEYPHELSGGLRQRVMIAMALSCNPSILVADEPTTALDVTIQAQVMHEIQKLQEADNMAMVMITHDMGVIAETCKNVVVMYCGSIIEQADVKTLFANPKHPYTLGLLESIPKIRENKIETLPTIKGLVPDLLHLPKGCKFIDRCPKAKKVCGEKMPEMTEKNDGSFVACYFPNM